MTFRERVKRVFHHSSKESKDSDSGKLKVEKKQSFYKKKRTDEWEDWPEHIYKPHEIPPPKYRRTPEKEHTAKLQAFSWGGEQMGKIRRYSRTSMYSPHGSRMPSRLNSVTTVASSDLDSADDPLSTIRSASTSRPYRRAAVGNATEPVAPISEAHSSTERSSRAHSRPPSPGTSAAELEDDDDEGFAGGREIIQPPDDDEGWPLTPQPSRYRPIFLPEIETHKANEKTFFIPESAFAVARSPAGKHFSDQELERRLSDLFVRQQGWVGA